MAVGERQGGPRAGTIRLADRMARLGTETAFEVLVRARALEARGVDVIHLEIGEPDFDTPANVVEAGVAALRAGQTHYVASAGTPDLRAAIAQEMARSRGVQCDPDQVVVTPGGKPIMFFAILALVNEGDEVLIPNPGFPIYESMVDFVGGVAVPLQLREDLDFRLDVDDLARRITPRSRLLILNSPENPTGSVLTLADLERIAKLAVEHDLIVLSDEIYSRILYEGTHHSIATLPGMAERTIILDGFSKTYAMTGWRLGFGVMPRELAPAISRLVTNSVSCTAHFVQTAGAAALTGPQDEVGRMVEEFRRRRQVIVEGLNSIPGIRCVMPAGAFYAFPNISGTGLDSKTFADRLLDEGGVAALSGTAFGRFGEGYLRLSYANSIQAIETAIERIRRFVAGL